MTASSSKIMACESSDWINKSKTFWCDFHIATTPGGEMLSSGSRSEVVTAPTLITDKLDDSNWATKEFNLSNLSSRLIKYIPIPEDSIFELIT
jgi:hypothetical protein